MKTLQFKTNIKCSGCIDKVTPALNDVVGKDKWDVDMRSPDKVLTVTVENLDAATIEAAVVKAGFTAQQKALGF